MKTGIAFLLLFVVLPILTGSYYKYVWWIIGFGFIAFLILFHSLPDRYFYPNKKKSP